MPEFNFILLISAWQVLVCSDGLQYIIRGKILWQPETYSNVFLFYSMSLKIASAQDLYTDHPSSPFLPNFFARSNAIFLLISRWLELNLIWLCCLYHVIKWGLSSYNWSWLGTSVPLSMVPTSLSLIFLKWGYTV